MRKIIYVIAVVCCCIACQDISEGYLISEYAGYVPDSMLVRTELESGMVEMPNPYWQQYYDEYYEYGYMYYDSIEEWVEFLHENGIYETVEEPGQDYDRARLEIPWVSTAIQGLEGTSPIELSITRVTTDVGDVDKMMEYLTVRNNGMLTLPFDHNVPKGRYVISLHVKGPGHSADLENIFTIIIE